MLDHPHQNHSINLSHAFMPICKYKINFLIYLFLTILQRNSKLVILINLPMPGHTHLKWQYHYEETFEFDQLSTSSFTFSLRYWKDTVNLLFWVLWAYWAKLPKVILTTCRKLLFICRWKINFISHAFLEILEK